MFSTAPTSQWSVQQFAPPMTSQMHTPSVSLAYDDVVYHVSLFKSGMHPGGLVLVSHLENGVGNAQGCVQRTS